MRGTSKCFINAGTEVVDQLKVGRKLEIISPAPLGLEALPSLSKSQLTLKEAVALDFALHTGEDRILIHNKTLWMSLCEKTYHKAGLSMKKSKNRYYLRVGITPTLDKRLKWALEETLNNQLEFLIKNGTSLPTYNYGSFETPPMTCEDDELDDWAPHFYEWTALVALDSPALHSKQNAVICNYFGYPNSSMQPLHSYSIEGLITPAYVHQVMAAHKVDWLVLTCHGFNQSPMAWDRPHHLDQGSEFGYTVVKSPKNISFKLISRGDL